MAVASLNGSQGYNRRFGSPAIAAMPGSGDGALSRASADPSDRKLDVRNRTEAAAWYLRR